ncbi:MAG: hypothetical protein RQ715_03000 [Methylococcales bacterium]|nr:hypothetical protein [Methylococcales bacterium]
MLRGLLLCFLLLPGLVQATTIRAVDMDQLLKHSQLIFIGQVRGREVLTDPSSERLFTRVHFAVQEVLKGALTTPELTLDFLGGQQGDRVEQVAEMVYPYDQEVGVYFVEAPEQRLVNPFYGWTQGHFVSVQDADGINRIRTATGQWVTGLDFTSTVTASQVSRDIAEGVQVRAIGQSRPAMTLFDFKQAIQEYLEIRP